MKLYKLSFWYIPWILEHPMYGVDFGTKNQTEYPTLVDFELKGTPVSLRNNLRFILDVGKQNITPVIHAHY